LADAPLHRALSPQPCLVPDQDVEERQMGQPVLLGALEDLIEDLLSDRDP
jgi:hypothetical protein